jgi:hypothetical protein
MRGKEIAVKIPPPLPPEGEMLANVIRGKKYEKLKRKRGENVKEKGTKGKEKGRKGKEKGIKGKEKGRKGKENEKRGNKRVK